MKNLNFLVIALAFVIGVSSCKKEENNSLDTNPTEVDNSLHFSFKTFDWERKVDCSHLDLFGNTVNDSTLSVWVPSASTNATFIFNYPADSSKMVSIKNLKKYGIADLVSNVYTPFTLGLKLPLTQGSSERLLSNTGFNQNEYCQITEIKYLKSDAKTAKFAVKGKYSLQARLLNSESAPKLITGTFNWVVNTSKK